MQRWDICVLFGIEPVMLEVYKFGLNYAGL